MSSSTAQRLRPLRFNFLLATLLPQAACSAGWHRIEPVVPSKLAKRQQVQVWQGRERLQLHAIRVDHDSVSGVPFHKPVDCDSCRISLPSSTVDSMRAGNPTAAFLKSVGLTLGSWLALGLLTYGVGGD
jgi:hypothetical protein